MSDTAEQPHRGAATDVAVRGGTKEEGGVAPMAERRDVTCWSMPSEDAISDAISGTAGGGRGHRSSQ